VRRLTNPRRQPHRTLIAITLLLFAYIASADPQPTPEDQNGDLEQVLVTGEQPGPGLWKVSKGDHVLWILGTSSPVPKRMQWHSNEVERAIAESQEVIGSVQVKIDIGFFRGLLLLPSVLGARKNPEGKELQDVLPPDVYARWVALKRKYIGNDSGIEKFRPIFAAQRLYSKAIDRVGMTWKDESDAELAHEPGQTSNQGFLEGVLRRRRVSFPNDGTAGVRPGYVAPPGKCLGRRRHRSIAIPVDSRARRHLFERSDERLRVGKIRLQ
jgi:hypothetical protein